MFKIGAMPMTIVMNMIIRCLYSIKLNSIKKNHILTFALFMKRVIILYILLYYTYILRRKDGS